MKGKRSHLVPLRNAAPALLDEAEALIGGTDFMGQSSRAAMKPMPRSIGGRYRVQWPG